MAQFERKKCDSCSLSPWYNIMYGIPCLSAAYFHQHRESFISYSLQQGVTSFGLLPQLRKRIKLSLIWAYND